MYTKLPPVPFQHPASSDCLYKLRASEINFAKGCGRLENESPSLPCTKGSTKGNTICYVPKKLNSHYSEVRMRQWDDQKQESC